VTLDVLLEVVEATNGRVVLIPDELTTKAEEDDEEDNKVVAIVVVKSGIVELSGGGTKPSSDASVVVVVVVVVVFVVVVDVEAGVGARAQLVVGAADGTELVDDCSRSQVRGPAMFPGCAV